MWFVPRISAIGPGGEGLLRLIEEERADRAGAGNRHERHHDPVADEQRGDDGDLLSSRRAQRKQCGGDVRDSDPLQHAREAEVLRAPGNALKKGRIGNAGHLSPPEKRKRIEQQTDQHDQQPAADDPAHHLLGRPLAQRQMRRDADDEQEERKDQIGRRPPVPRRVLERRIDRAPASRIVDEQHPGDGHAAKNVERRPDARQVRRGDDWRIGG